MERWSAFNCKFKDNRIKIKELIKIIYGDIYFFSRAYEVNRNRLISWFAGTDSSDVEVMIGYFLDNLPKKLDICCRRDNCFFSFCPYNHSSVSTSLTAKSVPYVLFIDGDNCNLQSLKDIPVPNNLVQIIVFHNQYNLVEYGIDLDLCLAKTTVKDAADVLMTFKASEMHSQLPMDVQFIMATADHFVHELIAQIHATRICHYIDPHDNNLAYEVNKIISKNYPIKDRRKKSKFYELYKSLTQNSYSAEQIETICNGQDFTTRSFILFCIKKGKKIDITQNTDAEFKILDTLIKVRKLLREKSEIDLLQLGKQVPLTAGVRFKYKNWSNILRKEEVLDFLGAQLLEDRIKLINNTSGNTFIVTGSSI